MSYEFSIVIPVYNEEKIVARSLDKINTLVREKSVLLVVVDNGSIDQTLSEIKFWHQNNPYANIKILHQSKKGALYAKKKGLFYAKKKSPVVVSFDIDCVPGSGFVNDIVDFAQNETADVLFGKIRHDPQTRLLKQLFLPNLMNVVAQSEELEKKLFGSFFFGGFFAIKSAHIDCKIFSSKISIKTEPSMFWSRHSFYLGLNFVNSETVARCSSRRFWHEKRDSQQIIPRQVAIRHEVPNSSQKLKIIKAFSQNENQLIEDYYLAFSRRILALLIDVILFAEKHPQSRNPKKVINQVTSFFEILLEELLFLQTANLLLDNQQIINQYQPIILDKIKHYKTQQ